MTEYITTHDQWLEEYRKDKRVVWVRALLSSGEEIYFKDYDTWLDIKGKCDSESLNVNRISLQYRSHIINVDTVDTQGVYLIRSLMGQMGAKSRQYYTIGQIKDGVVHKAQWLVPELIEEKTFEDTLDNCFEEAIIYKQD